jgi:hypothetical protein
VGNAGTVLVTQNRGASWTAQASGTVRDLYGVSCVRTFACLFAGNFGTVGLTVDGGTWSAVNMPTANDLRSVVFQDLNRAWVTGVGGTILANQTLTLGCSIVSVSGNPLMGTMAGAQVPFTATSTGCPNPRYEFWLRPELSNTWQLVQSYSASATYTWNSTGAQPGSEFVSVWARDATSSAAYDSFTSINYLVYPAAPCSSVTESATPPSPTLAGTQVTFTATATGCSSPSYQFWLLTPGASAWTIVRPYSSTATYSWNTTGSAAGIYSYSVWVRDASSTAGYDAFFPGTTYTLTTNACTSVTASAAPASPQAAGTAVTITAGASGCSNPRYTFWILPPGGSWTIALANSSTAIFNWNTTGLVAGTYSYSVWVRDVTSTGSYDAYFPGTAYTLTSTPCTSVTAFAAPASPQSAGTIVTITASAPGCTNARYEFWTLAPGGSWMIAQAYSSNASFTWNTTPPAGVYRYSVWVRDASSAGSYDAYVPGTTYALTTTPCTSVTASAAPASTATRGTTVVITATASGCSNARYEFWILAPGGSWTVAQAYSTSATFNWTTTGLPAGTYRYSVWVRDASSATSYDAFFPGTAFALT